ncbi:Rad60-SLD-2 domain-containing protein [Mycena chlorophos]|uniref:Rad60-SLD-2 domain-containing protein n=1 Tax=Mycena chlorophos TaxID=658473 RepID=A0A8H6TIB3_MYCCL|nr:Rad60-SLD-2 domain-containing protein [Mycena chlorophos]
MQQLPTGSVTLLLPPNPHFVAGGPYPDATASACTSMTRVDLTSDDDPTDDAPLEDSDEPQSPDEDSEPPQTSIIFLLCSGSRSTQSYDPLTTVKTVKDTLWDAWPSDWPDTRPPSASYLRLLHLGRVLQDEETLTKLGFPSHSSNSHFAPTIVHLAISASASRRCPVDDEVSGCHCIIC